MTTFLLFLTLFFSIYQAMLAEGVQRVSFGSLPAAHLAQMQAPAIIDSDEAGATLLNADGWPFCTTGQCLSRLAAVIGLALALLGSLGMMVRRILRLRR